VRALGVAAGLECTTDVAASIAFLKLSSVEISGFVAPSRTTSPTRTVPSAARASPRRIPSFTRASIAGTGISTMSGFSPAVSFCWMALITA
jgi:hypothetical protein